MTSSIDRSDRHRILSALDSEDRELREQAARTLVDGGAPQDVRIVLELLERSETEGDGSLIETLIHAFTQQAPMITGLLLDKVQQAPKSNAGHIAAAALGEIASQQGAERDPRILPVLLKALELRLDEGTWAVPELISGVRSCADAGPIPDASPVMIDFLASALDEPEPYERALRKALEVLAINDDSDLLAPLLRRASILPLSHPLRQLHEKLITDE